MTLKRELIPGEKITIIEISDFIAASFRRVWTITGKRGDRYTGKLKGKRKEFYLSIKGDNLVFAGEPDLMVDTDFNNWQGNACYNLVAESKEKVISILEESLLNTLSESTKGSILFFPLSKMQAGILPDGEVVFPEIEIRHAIIDQLK